MRDSGASSVTRPRSFTSFPSRCHRERSRLAVKELMSKGTEVLVGNVNAYPRRLHLARIGGQLEQYLGEP